MWFFSVVPFIFNTFSFLIRLSLGRLHGTSKVPPLPRGDRVKPRDTDKADSTDVTDDVPPLTRQLTRVADKAQTRRTLSLQGRARRPRHHFDGSVVRSALRPQPSRAALLRATRRVGRLKELASVLSREKGRPSPRALSCRLFVEHGVVYDDGGFGDAGQRRALSSAYAPPRPARFGLKSGDLSRNRLALTAVACSRGGPSPSLRPRCSAPARPGGRPPQRTRAERQDRFEAGG